jgi:serine/threonine protein kinase
MIVDARYEIGGVEGDISQTGKHYTLAAKDLESGAELLACALKPQLLSDASIVDAFVFGIERMKGLDHPSIIRVVASHLDRAGGNLSYVTQRIEGCSLSRLLRDGVIFTEREVQRIGISLLEALEYAHQRGVHFGNIKSNNIVVDASRGRAIIVGLPKPPFEFSSIPQVGAYVGLPHECPPELLKEGRFGPAADIYGVGLIMYEMCMGKIPFRAVPHLVELFNDVIEKPLPTLSTALPSLTPKLDRIITRAVQKEVEKRYPSAAEMRCELAAVKCQDTMVLTSERLFEIVNRYFPYPVAQAYKSIGLQIDDNTKLQRIVDTAHACIQLLASIVLADAISRNARQVLPKPVTPSAFARPSLGHWAQILRAGQSSSDRPSILGANNVYLSSNGDITPTGRAIEALVKLRNDIRHGATITQVSARKRIEEGSELIERLLKGALFFRNGVLFVPRRLDYVDGSFVCDIWDLSGSEASLQNKVVRLERPLTLDQVYIADSSFRNVVPLHPLVIHYPCRICEDEELFFYESAADERIHYISFSKGHEVSSEDVLPVFSKLQLV